MAVLLKLQVFSGQKETQIVISAHATDSTPPIPSRARTGGDQNVRQAH